MTKQADFKRRVRTRMAKTGEAYAAARTQLLASRRARERVRRGDGIPEAALTAAPVLHITNGDSAAGTLREADPSRRVVPWRDVLHEGPVPNMPAGELRHIRAAFLAGDETGSDADERQRILRWLEERDGTVAANRGGAYCLWFEADLYDQLQLVQILAQLHELHVSAGQVTLICIGEYPGIAHFGGLGELAPGQLQGLLASAAAPLTAEALELAARAWAALRAPTPVALAAIAATPSRELRFLAEAFDRLSREYPSTRDGLSLTERRILAAVQGGQRNQSSAATRAGTVFRQIAAREARPYLGDTLCWQIIRGLVQARVPLLSVEPPSVPDAPIDAGTHLRLTSAGERVLRGQADHVTLNGIDRWIGGVHLAGEEAQWRWDEGTEMIV